MALQSGTSSINELQEVPPASKESATPSIGPRCRQTTWLHRLRLVHVVLTGYTSEVELVSQDKLCVRRVWLARPRSSLVQARARGLPRLLSALGIFSCRTYKIFSRSARVWLRQTSLHNRCYRKFDRSEILSRRLYFLGNFIAERYFFLENIIAARKFDRSRCHGNQRLLSMTTQSLTPRNQSPVG